MTPLDAIRTRQPWLIAPETLDRFTARTAAFGDGQLFRDDVPTHPLLRIEDGVGFARMQGP